MNAVRQLLAVSAQLMFSGSQDIGRTAAIAGAITARLISAIATT